MDLRITPQTTLARALEHTGRQTTDLGKLQLQAATGKKLVYPSDDPARIGSLLESKAQESRLDVYVANIREARATLDQSVSTLEDVGDLFRQARVIAIEASSSTNSREAHEGLAQEVDRLIERLIELANKQHNARYLYSGAATRTQPFVLATDSQGRPQGATYQGSDQRDSVLISTQQTVATLHPGNEIFQYRQRGATFFEGTTGAAPGQGTDNATGLGSLLVRHTATTFAAGSGVAAGLNSAAGDTILGPPGAHQINIADTSGTGAFGTVSLNGGIAVPFTSADTDLIVTGPAGEVVRLDTTAITPGFNGAVAITASGTLSVDGGLSSVPINFSANQAVTHGADGTVTNVDTTAIRRAGTELLEYTGTLDAFQALIALRDDLRNTRALPQPQQLETLSRRINDIDRVHTGILRGIGEQSVSLQSMEQLENHLLDLQLTTRKLIADLEDVDLTEVVLQLQTKENLLRLTLGATSRIMDISLLDFLR